MIGLRSNFEASLIAGAAVFALAVLGAATLGRRLHSRGQPWLVPVARMLTVGAVVVVVVATALPRRLGIESDGDLVLQLGRAGLSDWRRALDEPLSLPSIQLVANVLLYVPVGFGIVIGWYHRRQFAVLACLGLSLAIETVQFLVIGRVAAVDDVVLNVAGGAIGWLAALIVARSTATGVIKRAMTESIRDSREA